MICGEKQGGRRQMGNRYKRMVTLGMISFTALLAWSYCMLAYHSKVVYIAVISLVLIGSIYALLLSVVDIKVAKEQAMQEYVTKTLQEYAKKDDTEILNDMERLAKASYVQQRKTNTYLSSQAEQLDEALKKTVKILINYDRKKEEEAAQQAEQIQKELEMKEALQAQKEPDHTALVLEELGKLTSDVKAVVAQLQQVTIQLTALHETVDTIEVSKYVAAPQAADVSTEPAQQKTVDIAETTDTFVDDSLTRTDAVQTDEEAALTAEPEVAVAEAAPTEEPEAVVAETTPTEEPEAVVAETTPTEEPEAVVAETTPTEEPEAVVAEAAPTEESKPAFDMEDFFSQYGGSADKELKEEAEFKEEAASTGMLDQNMIDALLGNLQADKPVIDVKNADVIPFPQQEYTDDATEEAHVEEVAEAVHEAEQDMTDTTVYADAESEHSEPMSAMPVDDNPNRTLSPEEIAALFASMQ
ncbi:hypothetical protein [Eubacterium sp. MSJ-33]|uniref:hypothetical protein n=1 Tax=Eubacterium sp. MSJ-33 TaxID=2841528 RepID=UPI001C76F80F|nr:hypothetical protein [Eubacterium sp. MSJ-33]QWT52399.1 hypothetical protein KP625_10000 [Eubacterium sp. MSJ-33]